MAAVGRLPAGTRTLMSPYAGGPVYQKLRGSILGFRRGVYKQGVRYIDRNYDLIRAASYGEPEVRIDYNKNFWRYAVDQTYHQGVLMKAHQDSLRWTPYAFVAIMVGALHIRFKHNDKYNVFAKWRTVD
jgi:hypothetical protein